MIYHVLLINAKMGILSPEIFIIPAVGAIEETQMLQRAAFHGFLYRFISSSLKGSMTAARSTIRIISLSYLDSSIYDLNFVCA